jgi:cell division protein FtsB
MAAWHSWHRRFLSLGEKSIGLSQGHTMLRKSQKRMWKWVLPVAILLTISFSLWGKHSLLCLYELKKQRDQMKEDILHLINENESLRREIYELKHSPEIVCRKAREELRLVKPGEIIYRYYTLQGSNKTKQIGAKECQEY